MLKFAIERAIEKSPHYDLAGNLFNEDHGIDRNCDVLPLSLEDLLNYTTLILKFYTNKPIWASLLRQVFWGEGKGGVFPTKRV